MGGSKKVTVGYWYYLGLHFGICHGPVDRVSAVVIGERNAWTGAQTSSGSISINAPELFGGEKKEGGVAGTLSVLMGESSQGVNSYLQAKIGGTIPAFRGILSAVWNGGKVTANNPYLKPWAFRVKRILQGWSGGSAWYPSKAEIGGYAEINGGWQNSKVTGSHWTSIDKSDNANWIAVGGVSAIRSTNQGASWSSAIALNLVTGPTNAVLMTGANTYVAAGASGYAARSTDGGSSWTSLGTITNEYARIDFLLNSGGKVFAVGQYGEPAVSSDAGGTWTKYPPVIGYATVYAAIAATAGVYIGGGNGRWTYWTGGTGGWASWDGPGYSAVSDYANYGVALGGSSILSLCEVNGAVYAAGANGRFGAVGGGYQTLLGGVSINSMAANGSTVIVVGQEGRMQRSTDGGSTWDAYLQLVTAGYHLTEIKYQNGSWLAAGIGGRGAVSVDDGATWTAYTTVTTDTVNDIQENAGTWTAVGQNGWVGFLPLTVYPQTGDMNPAHIIYQCLTDTSWGMGYPASAIDSTSFTDAADTLFSEQFGLSVLWNQQDTIESFMQLVLDHIGGILYVQPSTGKFALRLIRADYDRGTLPLYGTTTLISADDYQRQAWGETVNEITVVYIDGNTEKEQSVTIQDIANIAVQGGVVAQTHNYHGIRNASLAQRVAMRDLQAGATPLASIKLTANRAAWAVFPGDVFRLSWPEYDIDDVVFRALTVNRGTLTDGQIIIDAVEDVFGLPSNTYLVEQEGAWADPSEQPTTVTYRKLVEAPYWDLARNLSAADLAYVDALSGYLETLAVRSSAAAVNYDVQEKVGAASYESAGSADFCPSATIVGALTKTTTAITLSSGFDLDLVEAGGYAIIDNEYVKVSAIDATALTATISRGLLDTVPADHTAGARIWFADGWQGFSTTEYADTETVDVKMLPATGQGTLDISLAPYDSLTMDQRQYRPYPPGKLLVNTSSFPAWIDGAADLAITWAHRDRLSQTAYLVEQSENSIGPEASVTYTLRIYGEAGTLVHTYSGLTGTSQTYPGATESSESGLSRINGKLRFELESVRGGLVSYQNHNHIVLREGYGFNYGYYYGGQ